MAKRLWIQLYNEETASSITLPVNPESIDISETKDIKTHEILGHGEVAVRGFKKLQEITLSSFLPDKDTYLSLLASFIDKTEFKPYTTVATSQMINKWVEDDVIIRVIIADGLNEGVNKPFLIKSFKKTMRESIADLDYELQLIEYNVPGNKLNEYQTNTKTIEGKIVSKVQKLASRINNKYIPAQMVVKQGQTIYKLARLYYGGRGNNLLAKLNNVVDQNRNLAGQIIEMLPVKSVLKNTNATNL